MENPQPLLNSLFQCFSFFIVNIFSPNISSEFPLLLHVMDLMILVGPFQLGTFYDSYEERQERLRDLELFSLAKKRLREILSMSINTRKEGARGTEPSSFQWWPVPGQEAIGTNQRAQEFAWTLPYCAGDRAPQNVAQRGCRASILGDIQKLSGHGSGQVALSDPAWEGLDQMTSRSSL